MKLLIKSQIPQLTVSFKFCIDNNLRKNPPEGQSFHNAHSKWFIVTTEKNIIQLNEKPSHKLLCYTCYYMCLYRTDHMVKQMQSAKKHQIA